MKLDVKPEEVTSSEMEFPGKLDQFGLFLEFVHRHRKLLGQSAVIGLALGLCLSFAIPNYYTSTVRLLPPEGPNTSSLLMSAAASRGISGPLADIGASMLASKNTGALYTRVLLSRTVEDAVITRFDLRRVYFRKYYETARKKLESRAVVSEDKKSGVITIEVTDSDRERSNAMAQTFVDESNKLLATVSTSTARRERLFIEQRLVTVQSDLKAAEKKLSDFAAANTTLDVKEQTKAMVAAGAELQANIIASRSELESLQQTYTDNNIRVRSLKARIAELQKSLDKLGGTADQPESPNQMYPSLRRMPRLGAQWTDLYRDAQVQEKLYELLIQQYELSKIQEAREIPVLKELDSPVVPERKSWPPRTLFTLIVLTIVVGAVMAKLWLREYLSTNPENSLIAKVIRYLSVLSGDSGASN